ncbi:Glycolipid sulfotransferase [Ruegeria denitrificans]|uniref:Glycolipid sulfotransferase n=1 Tax=Ruegeria denitrificans TaxID=1715692 RepID=A0A0P1IJP6_9RHOB|nr:sulfotransferase domain-containing protein [Ruegeria denitrificans]CUK17419.1 Glycolipid sulfotransferase [Ruegeria denitrificans]
MNDVPEDGAPPSGPPWIVPEIQQKIAWRDGDVVISVPIKSGTTWTMNIVHQLLTGGTDDFRDVYEEVPWIEFLAFPGQPQEVVVERVTAMPTNTRRAFKTHSPPPAVPFQSVGSGTDVKYVVIMRNPEEALVSFRPFLNKHSDAWYELWGVPREALCRPDFPSFYSDVIDANGMQGAIFGFLAAWWPLRNEPNVLFLHFSDMKSDHQGSIRKIAEFIGEELTEEQWANVLEFTSFPWMKANEGKFEGRTASEIPILNSGAMIRKGAVGEARMDGMTEEISQHLREVGGQICPDPVAIKWVYEGGTLLN